MLNRLFQHLYFSCGVLVTTFVTEDGQTGQIIISGDGSYPREMTTAEGTITLEDIEIASGGGNVLSLEEDSMGQIPGTI